MPVTAPSDQVTVPAHPLAVSVKVDGEQTERLPGGVITGAAVDALLCNTEINLISFYYNIIIKSILFKNLIGEISWIGMKFKIGYQMLFLVFY